MDLVVYHSIRIPNLEIWSPDQKNKKNVLLPIDKHWQQYIIHVQSMAAVFSPLLFVHSPLDKSSNDVYHFNKIANIVTIRIRQLLSF